MSWQAVTFYTTGTGYETEAKRLVASAGKLNVPLRVYEYPPAGTWRENLNFKSESILRAMDEFPGTDIVFVDCDAIFHRWPKLFDELSAAGNYDIAAHFHPYRGSVNGGSLLSGTLWFRNGPEGRRLVEEWHRIGAANPDIRHQHCLKLAVNELRAAGEPVRVYRLPREYTLIFDYYKGTTRPKAPVIEHFQASRRFRSQVGRGPMLLSSNFERLADKDRGRRHVSMPQRRAQPARSYRGIQVRRRGLRGVILYAGDTR